MKAIWLFEVSWGKISWIGEKYVFVTGLTN
jgi:hypothetical protein